MRAWSTYVKPGLYRQGPVMAKVMPGVWMFAKSHLPSGLQVAPAHSKPRKSPDKPFFSPCSTTLFRAMGKTWPSCPEEGTTIDLVHGHTASIVRGGSRVAGPSTSRVSAARLFR